MMVGVGIDIIKTVKMKQAVEKWGDSFINRVFEQEELENIFKGKMYYQRLAGRFAAKEAVIKAVSKKYPMALKDIIILNKNNGAPFCKFRQDLEIKVLLSITHIEEYAVACAVAEEKN